MVLQNLTKEQIKEIRCQFKRTSWASNLIDACMSLEELHQLQEQYKRLGYKGPYYHAKNRRGDWGGWSLEGPITKGDTPNSAKRHILRLGSISMFRDVESIINDPGWPGKEN